MTETELKKLNERLLKACGFTHRKHPQGNWHMWYTPDGKFFGNIPPNLTTDHNACFKWIVPVLKEKGITLINFGLGDQRGCFLHRYGEFHPCSIVWAKTESLAFCLAADKFLSEEK
jgi:hypothetical protein